MKLEDIRIDEETWSTGHDARRLEWRSAIQGIINAPDLSLASEITLIRIRLTQQSTELAAFDEAGRRVSEVTLPHDILAPHIQEYVDIVRQLAKTDSTGGLARLEALDMAKKVCHDRAGRTILRRCRALGLDHPTARRFYTLLVTLRVDTTRLVGVHGHRRIR